MEGGFAPFSFRTKSGKLSGFEVALAKDVAKQLKLKPVFVQTKFDSLISGLDTKKYDVVYNDRLHLSAKKPTPLGANTYSRSRF
ncbi:transporter substrate-binding domain-containing protein [Weissella cibaria]|uniref:transporter substrate-binding domain-containing protein n=1 Tax=Weissella cibaria TaxID=137591 RepID=UPI00376EB037